MLVVSHLTGGRLANQLRCSFLRPRGQIQPLQVGNLRHLHWQRLPSPPRQGPHQSSQIPILCPTLKLASLLNCSISSTASGSQRKAISTMAPTDRDVLSDEVKPIHYDIKLFDLELGGSFNFQGLVNIEFNVKSAIESVTLNAHQLLIHGATIEGAKVNGTFIPKCYL